MRADRHLRKVPVLFLIFNRPDETALIFNKIRAYQPDELYIAGDGPRPDSIEDVQRCEAARLAATAVDWDCKVKTLFRDKNLGCKLAVSSAISWFFEQVPEGIILEDDCLPEDTFFEFCAELLAYYRNDERVFSISGSNLMPECPPSLNQSYFRGYGGIWGWATWRRAWKQYDIGMSGWADPKVKRSVKAAMGNADWFRWYYGMFAASFEGTIDSWDLQWFYSILVHNAIAINPMVNLVKNIGFGNGTHTHTEDDHISRLQTEAISFPIRHPQTLVLHKGYLKKLYRKLYQANDQRLYQRIFKRLKKII